MGAILDRGIAEQAVRIADMTFTGMLQENFFNRNALHVVVLDPTRRYDGHNTLLQAILYEESFGEPRVEWERPFDEFARKKAYVAWRTAMDTHLVQQRFPHLYEGDDIK